MKMSKRKITARNPKYKIGDIIEVVTENKSGPGIKDLKPGRYKIINFRDAYLTKDECTKTYEFMSIRKNSKYVFCMHKDWLEQNSKLI